MKCRRNMMFSFLYRTWGFKIVIYICFIKSSEISTEASMCEKERNLGCCDGFFWNPKTKKCTACTPGYLGPNCSIPCPYPQFGVKCQMNCTCNKDNCNITTGCTNLTKDNETFSVTTTSRNFGGNTTFRSMQNQTSKFSGDETSLPATMASTNFGENTTIDTANISTTKFPGYPGTNKHVLILLIKGFGGVDILLICSYAVILMIDRYNKIRAIKTNRGVHSPRPNSMYENIEIVFSPND